jgi:TRAP-type C4-dicarboxylate transport system permease small subunit
MMSRLNLLRNVFLIIFILTILWFCIFGIPPLLQESNSTKDLLAISISLVTSVITFLGFVITTILSFRREKRETRDAELSQKQKEIELERAHLELEQLKKQVNKKKK